MPGREGGLDLARSLADLVGRTVVYTAPAPPRPSRRVSWYRPNRKRTIAGMAERRPAKTAATTVMRIAERPVTIQIRGLVLEGGPAGHSDKRSLLIGMHPSANVVAPITIQNLRARAIHARSVRPDRPFNTEGDLSVRDECWKAKREPSRDLIVDFLADRSCFLADRMSFAVRSVRRDHLGTMPETFIFYCDREDVMPDDIRRLSDDPTPTPPIVQILRRQTFTEVHPNVKVSHWVRRR